MTTVISETSIATRSAHTSYIFDNTDWLKIAAIILVSVDHIGYFFMGDADWWWRTFGRLAAPVFFFLMGYAQSRTVPLHWIWLGVVLTLFESWNADWTWVAPNILLSFALIRVARPLVHALIQHHGWPALAILVFALVAVLPGTSLVAEYGAAGWLWALLGFCQRMYIDGTSATDLEGEAQGTIRPSYAVADNLVLMRPLVCVAAAVLYVWQEQTEFAFPQIHLASFIVGIAVLSLNLCLFRRGPSLVQPPPSMVGGLRYISLHTLEIYAIQLAGSELFVKLLPDLVP